MIDDNLFLTLYKQFVTDKYADNTAFSAAKYALLGDGKRKRFLLSLNTAEIYGNAQNQNALRLAFAIELIHNYSLVHDDLPCMDNSLTRRNKPSCFATYGAGQATLAGDLLLNLAAEVLFDGICDKNYFEASHYIFDCAGGRGMIDGQSNDISADEHLNFNSYVELVKNKTSKLFCASVVPQAILAGDTQKNIDDWQVYCTKLGLAYQFADDLTDDGEDKNTNILTFFDRQTAVEQVKTLCDQALTALNNIDKNTIFHKNLLNSVLKSIK